MLSKETIRCENREGESSSHYDRDFFEESDDLYLKAQEMASKRNKERSPDSPDEMNTKSIE